MRLVVDANILFSFFKKDSITRELILDPELEYGLELYAPKFVLEELEKHKNDICSKFGIYPKDFDVMFSSLQLFIKFVKKELFNEFFSEAENILGKHIKDVPYIALALSFKNRGYEIALWSKEERLKLLEKYTIKVYSTSDLLKGLGAK